MIDETAGLEPPTSDDRLIWDVWLSVYHFPTPPSRNSSI